jgi:flagellar biosynthesis chaperone FliJ
MSTYALDKLLDLRRTAEETAALTLTRATAAAGQARTASEALKRAMLAARRVWEQERAVVATNAQRASEALTRHRFVDRLASTWADRRQQIDRHRALVLEPAMRSEESARQAYLTARQERQAVENHIQRQRTAARVIADRRDEES